MYIQMPKVFLIFNLLKAQHAEAISLLCKIWSSKTVLDYLLKLFYAFFARHELKYL